MADPAIQIPYLGQILTGILVLLAAYLALKIGKKIVLLVINSFIGLVLLLLANYIPFVQIPINVWTILIAGFGGIAGVILLVVLGQLGIAF
ncbi:MAG TPA: pro-sigmaK processing inhibitor BofA family protein [archaeon]|nr:pro-sigmaK processing inhibitor BofA family protein [archaeon]